MFFAHYIGMKYARPGFNKLKLILRVEIFNMPISWFLFIEFRYPNRAEFVAFFRAILVLNVEKKINGWIEVDLLHVISCVLKNLRPVDAIKSRLHAELELIWLTRRKLYEWRVTYHHEFDKFPKMSSNHSLF